MTIEEMFDYVKNQLSVYQETNEELQEKIDKAIEYLEDREYDNNTCSVCSVMSDDLLEILKGDDNEPNN